MLVNFVEPNLDLITYIAENMRDQDAEEVWCSNRKTPLEALTTGWDVSDYATIATVDDEPVVMFGVSSRDILSGAGIIWLLGTDKVLRCQRSFMRYTYKVIEDMLQIYSLLYNYVYSGNTVSMVWLKRVGFTIGAGQPFGPSGEIFHKFQIERCI